MNTILFVLAWVTSHDCEDENHEIPIGSEWSYALLVVGAIVALVILILIAGGRL